MIVPLRRARIAGQDELDQAGGAEEIHLELAASFLQRHVLDSAVGAVARVVHQDVDAAGLGEDLLDAQSRGFVVGDIHREGLDAALAQVLHPIGTAGHAVHQEAGLMQAQGGRLPDSRGCPGDESDLLMCCRGHVRRPRS